MREFILATTIAVIWIGLTIIYNNISERRRQKRKDYYRNVYLKSDAWRRKRYLVLKRDEKRCVYCGSRATQVHHLKYARKIGREPIDWLVSICDSCHINVHLE